MTDTDVAYDPFAPGFVEDPYGQYAGLRAHDPVHPMAFGGFYVSRHADVFALLRDNSLSVEDRHATPGPLDEIRAQALDGMEDLARQRSLSMLDRDPPDHDRLRKLVSRAFTPRRVAELEPRIQALVDTALDRAAAAGGMEAIGELAFPLPFQVISEMLGMPETDMARVRDLSGTLVRSLEPVVDPEVIRAIQAAGVEFGELLDGVIAWKRDHPGDDLLTTMMEARLDPDDPSAVDGGDRLTDDELGAQLALLFVAGHETTVNLIGNGLAALCRHPDQLDVLRADPDLIANAVDELLRFDPPVQNTRRINVVDLELHGRHVPAGSFVVCGLASANRDRAHFGPTADELDVARADAHDHLAFGGGGHYCLGANLAKLEARVAIGSVVRRFADVAIAGDTPMNGRINLRGLAALPLSLG